MNDDTQVRHDQLAGSIEILPLAEADCKRVLVFLAQYRQRADGVDVSIETAYRAGQYEVAIGGGNCCCHSNPPFWANVSTRAFRVLTNSVSSQSNWKNKLRKTVA